jgi:hypothetical protein
MKRRARNRWVILGGAAAIACVLILSAAGYWHYVNSVPRFDPQLPSLPQPNGYERAESAARQLLQVRRPMPKSWPRGTPEEIRTALEPVYPILDEVRAAYRLEWRTRPAMSFSAAPAGQAEFRKCARSFAAASMLARSQGDHGTAMQWSLDAMELGSRLPRGGGLIARMLGLASHAIGFREAERADLDRAGSEIHSALERVRRVRRHWPTVSESLEGERITTLAGYTAMFEDFQRLPFHEKIDGLRALQAEPGLGQTLRLALTPRRATMAALERYFQDMIAESEKPVHQRVSVPLPEDPWTQVATLDLMPDFHLRMERPALDLALLEVALAVRMHALEHGRYPAGLGEISPRWLPAVPQDLWGQPVVYRLRGAEPLIYSLGPDGKDDRGQAVPAFNVASSTRGDLVFGRLYKR